MNASNHSQRYQAAFFLRLQCWLLWMLSRFGWLSLIVGCIAGLLALLRGLDALMPAITGVANTVGIFCLVFAFLSGINGLFLPIFLFFYRRSLLSDRTVRRLPLFLLSSFLMLGMGAGILPSLLLIYDVSADLEMAESQPLGRGFRMFGISGLILLGMLVLGGLMPSRADQKLLTVLFFAGLTLASVFFLTAASLWGKHVRAVGQRFRERVEELKD